MNKSVRRPIYKSRTRGGQPKPIYHEGFTIIHPPQPATPQPATHQPALSQPAPGPNAIDMPPEEYLPQIFVHPLSLGYIAAGGEEAEEAAMQVISNRDLSVQWGIRRWPEGTQLAALGNGEPGMEPDEIYPIVETTLQPGEYYGYIGFGNKLLIVKQSTEYSQYDGMELTPYYSNTPTSKVWEDDQGGLFVETWFNNEPEGSQLLRPLAIARMPGENWMIGINPDMMIRLTGGGRKKKSTKKRKSRKTRKSRKSRK